MLTERRSCVRHKVRGPLFASFDGVTGGMILDLSEQGLSMQTAMPLETDRQVQMEIGLPDSEAPLEMTAYVAWADALGRAGIRFSELPEEARQRLDQWLAVNDETLGRRAPKLAFQRDWSFLPPGRGNGTPKSVSLEAEAAAAGSTNRMSSSTAEFQFHSLGSDLNSALRVISERAQKLLRGSSSAVALMDGGWGVSKAMLCCASIGSSAPPLGTPVCTDSGFSGECVRTGRSLRCDDAESDPRVDAEACRHLRIRSIVAAPVRYEREIIGLLEVFSPDSFAFDEGDLAVLERLAQTVLRMITQSKIAQPRPMIF